MFRQVIGRNSEQKRELSGPQRTPTVVWGLSHSREFSGFGGSNPGVLPAPTPVPPDRYLKLRLQTV